MTLKINYFVVGTNNMEASIQFYDALFENSGLTQVRPNERMTYWLRDEFAFAAALPFDGEPATNGNGTMVGFSLGSASEVARMYSKAIELGGTCEGEPQQRGPRFSAYVRDLDRNKLCFAD
ncbi:VOC family protein [Leisingera aquaemixtae]|uniref:VOC family protein n=1 Tax=Leisingera aquaemixtae TaxID=1396826 RepID=UPI00396569E2